MQRRTDQSSGDRVPLEGDQCIVVSADHVDLVSIGADEHAIGRVQAVDKRITVVPTVDQSQLTRVGVACEQGERIIVAARAEIEQETNQAREELRGKVIDLAVAASRQILDREVKVEDHNAALEKLSASL